MEVVVVVVAKVWNEDKEFEDFFLSEYAVLEVGLVMMLA
jgi:hypothetical protein